MQILTIILTAFSIMLKQEVPRSEIFKTGSIEDLSKLNNELYEKYQGVFNILAKKGIVEPLVNFKQLFSKIDGNRGYEQNYEKSGWYNFEQIDDITLLDTLPEKIQGRPILHMFVKKDFNMENKVNYRSIWIIVPDGAKLNLGLPILIEDPESSGDILECITYNNKMQTETQYPILTDQLLKNFMDPRLAIEDVFSSREHFSNQNLWKITINNTTYILKHSPGFVFNSHEENVKEKMKKVQNEIEFARFFQYKGITNFRKFHHAAMKIYWNSHYKCFMKEIWQIVEYVPGQSIIDFDYSVTHRGHTDLFVNSLSHAYGKTIPIQTTLNFLLELAETHEKLMCQMFINPHQFNDNNIIINFENNQLKWKFLNYANYEENPTALTNQDVLWPIMNWSSILWRMLEYTPNKDDPVLQSIDKFVKDYDERYRKNFKKDATFPFSEVQNFSHELTTFISLKKESYTGSWKNFI